jgi:hypothetical protein
MPATRKVPRPFEMHWGKGMITEEAAFSAEYHEPAIQLLEYEDGSLTLRFCSYNHEGRFQRSPLMLSADDIDAMRTELRKTPKLLALIQRLAALSPPES